jgi:RES domain-containing protein
MPLAGVFSRCATLGRDPLSTEGSRLFGGRFNPPGLPALYLAGTPTLALAEQLRFADLLGLPVRHTPRLLVAVDVRLAAVLDLTDAGLRRGLGLDDEILWAEWESGPQAAESPTQTLGRRVREEGLEGILYPSRVERAGRNLVVFLENLQASSRVRLVGEEEVTLS